VQSQENGDISRTIRSWTKRLQGLVRGVVVEVVLNF